MGLLKNKAATLTAKSMANKVDIVNGMVELQSLSKPAHITTCTDLAEHFKSELL